jgi:hypothetical protein
MSFSQQTLINSLIFAPVGMVFAYPPPPHNFQKEHFLFFSEKLLDRPVWGDTGFLYFAAR